MVFLALQSDGIRQRHRVFIQHPPCFLVDFLKSGTEFR